VNDKKKKKDVGTRETAAELVIVYESAGVPEISSIRIVLKILLDKIRAQKNDGEEA